MLIRLIYALLEVVLVGGAIYEVRAWWINPEHAPLSIFGPPQEIILAGAALAAALAVAIAYRIARRVSANYLDGPSARHEFDNDISVGSHRREP